MRASLSGQVVILSANRVDEAGWSPDREVVLVVYQTAGPDPTAPARPAQPIYLSVVRRAGHWLVDGTWAPLAGPPPSTASTRPKPSS